MLVFIPAIQSLNPVLRATHHVPPECIQLFPPKTFPLPRPKCETLPGSDGAMRIVLQKLKDVINMWTHFWMQSCCSSQVNRWVYGRRVMEMIYSSVAQHNVSWPGVTKYPSKSRLLHGQTSSIISESAKLFKPVGERQYSGRGAKGAQE